MRYPYCPAVLLACLAFASEVRAQNTSLVFSVDWHGPMQGVKDSLSGQPITPGDLMQAEGGLPAFNARVPEILIDGGVLGLVNYNQCVGSPPGSACGVEVDALSFGRDMAFPKDPKVNYRLIFCVDEYARGRTMPGPSIATEAPIGDICGDLITTLPLPPVPILPGQAGRHIVMIDGDGMLNPSGQGFVSPGLGLTEPNIPDTGLPNNSFDFGDHIDAFDMGRAAAPDTDPIWFSVDSRIFDPRAGVPNSGTSAVQGVSGADIILRAPSGGLSVYARAKDLGLDELGTDTDDVDALIIAENGVPGYQPSVSLFDWLPAGGTDLLVFSVRRGSAIIGSIDFLLGIPISPGDLLIPPPPGLAHQNPGIIVAAESMGMQTSRSGGTSDDDLGGADCEPGEGDYLDCQPNGIDDAIDIASGSPDKNANGIPDECEPPGTRYCFCDSTSAPCGNADPSAGCANSTGKGANLDAMGSSSMAMDDLVLQTDQMPVNKFGIYFMGDGVASVFVADGILCVGGTFIKRFSALGTGTSGSFFMGPGLINTIDQKWGSGLISAGTTLYFQSWYRGKKSSPCGSGSNLSNGLAVTFTM